MDSHLAIILMTATFMLGAVYGALPKTFPLAQSKNAAQPQATRPIDPLFVAIFSTRLPRYYAPRPRPVNKRVPQNIHWVEAEADDNPK